MTHFRQDIYKKYDLTAVDFDQVSFHQRWANLLDNNLGNIYDTLQQEAGDRLFLKEPLSQAALAQINEHESVRAALLAEQFQEKVAQVIIVESKEGLVDLRSIATQQHLHWEFTDEPYHPACGEWAGRERLFLVRKTMGNRLVEMSQKLEKLGLSLYFQDGFRPMGVQEGLFRRRIDMARTSHPSWNDEDILLEARSKTAYTPRFAAHKAGAAVDVQLKNRQSGTFHDIGHHYPDGGEIVRLDTEFVTQPQWENRKILQHIALSAKLLMYPFEDWHLCLDDATAAVVTGKERPYVAHYGPVKSYDTKTGEITDEYSPEELDTVFPFEET
jgi:D-alanyl-D-alanine dipeptidase